MNEAEWLESLDPWKMLKYLEGKVSDRKLRLYAVACCWGVTHLFPSEVCCDALHTAERLAEGEVSPLEVTEALGRLAGIVPPPQDSRRDVLEHLYHATAWTLKAPALEAAQSTGNWCYQTLWRETVAQTRAAGAELPPFSEFVRPELERHVRLLRDVVGRPSVRWRKRMATTLNRVAGGDAVRIARAVWEERDFASLPVLADALEDAGCTDREVFAHCREPGEHVRGCWVVDFVLGKE
jgi:hypothetical protein